MLSEKSPTQKAPYRMITPRENIQKTQIRRESKLVVAKGWWDEKMARE